MSRLSKTSLFTTATFLGIALQLPVFSQVPSSKADAPGAETAKKSKFELSSNEAAELSAKIDEQVCKDFFDAGKANSIWKPKFEAMKQTLCAQNNLLDYSAKINELLQQLNASHTQFLTENDEPFFFMRCLFGAFKKDESNPHKNDADFVGLGVGGVHAARDQVRYVLDGSPADIAKFKRGDKIVSVNGQSYSGYDVWSQTSGKDCDVIVERQGKKLDLKVRPVKQDFLKGYVSATEKSAKIIPFNNRKIAYLHFWSGGEGSRDELESAICGSLKDSDALILDLRDGYGGASLQDIDIFFRPHSAFPDMTIKTRTGGACERSFYDKPLAVLINGGTRSGKELMAFGLKRSRRARLFGESTAGYVLAGRFSPLNNRTCLYLAISDISLEGERLEGKGVAPDVLVADKLGADDLVLKSALNYLSSIPPKSKK